jgi:hypothetical protein
MTIKPEIIAMSSIITKGLAVDKKEGTITAGADIFQSTLPEDLSMETVQKVREHNTTFVAAGAHSFGTASIDLLAGNKKLDRITTEISLGGKDNVTYSMDRSKTTVDHLHGKGEVVKFGVLTTTLETVAGKNAGQLKAVRTEMGTIAMERLSK